MGDQMFKYQSPWETFRLPQSMLSFVGIKYTCSCLCRCMRGPGSQVFSSIPLCLLLNPELIDLAQLAGQWVPGIPLSPYPQSYHTSFLCVSRNLNSGPHAWAASALLMDPFLHPCAIVKHMPFAVLYKCWHQREAYQKQPRESACFSFSALGEHLSLN